MNYFSSLTIRVLMWASVIAIPCELLADKPPTAKLESSGVDDDDDAVEQERPRGPNSWSPTWRRGFRQNTQSGGWSPRQNVRYEQDVEADEWTTQEPIEGGWVFLNGKYLPPPYTIESSADSITINDHQLPTNVIESFSSRFAGYGRFGRGGRRTPSWQTRRGGAGSGLKLFLEVSEGVLLVSEGMPTIYLNEDKLGLELLSVLSGRDDAPTDPTAWVQEFSEELRPVVQELIENFEATDDFTARATATIEDKQLVEAKGRQQIAAVRRLESWNYPLSILAMVLCVGAFGHLIKSHPSLNPSLESSTAVRNQIYLSLGLAGLFSLHDLILTLLTIDAGAMRETNPIAAEFVHNPYLLVAFKVGLTLFGLGVMAVLWKRRIAQLASWWVCLVLTLLTARWLIVGALLA
ncbi:DUF5658 family protein [Thalassoroseus pseudoceratinae]|uniref:DUF5658 family protein n=1 Tax=Thalassoroseus pseudoceratinae TaxID=2713176 RepID=UPI0014226EED|nr:DUF5658 family protein [Thalassoroseus pseudoceratinae]